MRIVLNFIPLKRGGGVQVGLDFIKQLATSGTDHECLLVATQGTPFADVVAEGPIKGVHLVPGGLLQRLYFEYIGCRRLLKDFQADVVYTQFGPYWPGASVVNVAGCAYSNLMYPELDFWGALPFHKKLIKQFIDFFRKKRMLGSDVIVYETEDLARRSRQQNALDDNRVKFVLPAASSLLTTGEGEGETERKIKDIPRGFRVLLLAVYHPNKNIELLPPVAECLRDQYGIEDVIFVTTLPLDHPGTQGVLEDVARRGVQSSIHNFGPIPQQECHMLYRAVDAVILPSRLESFSNNIAESWIMQKPLLISDFDWSRSLCGDGVIYIRYDDPEDTAKELAALYNSKDARDEVVRLGLERLKAYPTPEQRFRAYLDIIEQAVEARP